MDKNIQHQAGGADAPVPTPTDPYSEGEAMASAPTDPHPEGEAMAPDKTERRDKRRRIEPQRREESPVATASPDGSISLDERALQGFIPISEVERDYMARTEVEEGYMLRSDVERDYISREEARRAEEAAFERGRESRIESAWSDEAPDEIADIFRTRRSVWDA